MTTAGTDVRVAVESAVTVAEGTIVTDVVAVDNGTGVLEVEASVAVVVEVAAADAVPGSRVAEVVTGIGAVAPGTPTAAVAVSVGPGAATSAGVASGTVTGVAT